MMLRMKVVNDVLLPARSDLTVDVTARFTGVHINQDLIWRVKAGVYLGFWVHRGS